MFRIADTERLRVSNNKQKCSYMKFLQKLCNKLNSLPDGIKQVALDGKITVRQALTMTRLNSKDTQIHALNSLIFQNLTDEATEDLISELL